jgi:AraC-like DNA-binding protein
MAKDQSTDGVQGYWHRDPAPELASLVTGIHGYAEAGAAMNGVVEAASLDVPLIINFGTPFRIGLGRRPTQADRYASFAAGLFLGPVLMDSDGEAQCIQVNFTPLGGSRFFGMPMHELADRMVPLADLGDRDINRLAQRLGELNSWEARLDLVEAFVRGRLQRSKPADPALAWAFQRLAASQGRARIGAISGRLEWSRRKLVARFRHDLGLPPKAVARIIRFGAARAMASESIEPDWADIAAACGYADQAHLSREFSELAGSPPAAWRAAA